MKKHTSQPLIAARIALRPCERLELPRMKKGNPSDSKAETGNDIVERSVAQVAFNSLSMLFVRAWQTTKQKYREKVKLDGN